MRVPVIAVLNKQEPLQESAFAARTAAPRGILPETQIPDRITVDAKFSAIPIGSGSPEAESMATVAPEVSERFAIRGSIEVDSVDDIPDSADGADLFGDPRIEPFQTCANDPALGSHADVGQKLRLAALHDAGLDGDRVAVAILDTGINLPHLGAKLGAMPRFDAANSWLPPGLSGSPGQLQIGHGTMCAYEVLIAAPKATLLDFPILLQSVPGGSSMGRRLSIALLGYAQLLAFWAVAFAAGGGPNYRALVVNNSWGMYHPSWDFPAGHPGRYANNPAHPFNVLVATLARANADILFAAGNCGADCPDGRCQSVVTHTITGANSLAEVWTVAGCDVNDDRVGYSSQGPAIAGMGLNKPDITAFTHFLGSEVFGAASADSGTSAACPIAAGCVAALRTTAAPVTTPPAALFAQLNLTARKVSGPGWNGDFGNGIIDPVAAAQTLGLV